MAKKKPTKPAKKRVSKYDEKFSIDVPLEEMLKISVKPTPKSKK
jgi:hypothetical protein